ncbi:peptidoglycan-binding protein [Microvirga antarctica]|uniref:peptidoglycan-binding protein n=1 Tax=Microvirga antarctica TaxID=2819233 RepID=UPI001B3115FF|nr:peptidoglycan-binding protein [Microvirga antarctica]
MTVRRFGILSVVVAAAIALPCIPTAHAQNQIGRAAASVVGLDAAKAAFETLPEADRKAIQDALIWTGAYSGTADGTFGRQTFEAVSAFLQSQRKPGTGILSAAERAELQTLAQRARMAAGFTVVDDSRAGVRIGVPTRLLPKQVANANGGSRWQSADDRVTLDTRTVPADATLESLYERNLALQINGRTVTYKVLRPDFFVIAGETPSGRFYTRYGAGSAGIRGFSIGYDKSLAPQLDRVVVAIANSFDPSGRAAPAAGPTPATSPSLSPSQAPVAALPASRRLVGTGIAMTPRRVITTADLAGCTDLQAGDRKASPVKAQDGNGAGVLIIDLAQALPSELPKFATAEAASGDPVLILGYSTDDGRTGLSAVPGTMADGQSVLAPLQSGASGAPVLDAANALIGLVAPPVGDGRRIAGIATSRRYTIVPVRQVQEAASWVVPSLDPKNAVTGGAANAAAAWRTAVVPLTCAP